MPEFIVDNREIDFIEGDSIMSACDRAGITIPRLCYHPFLPGGGNCRMCLVMIEGRRKPEPACITKAEEGMKVESNSEEILRFRKGLLELLLINHPLDCPVCDKAGECSLQNYYMEYGLFESRYDFPKNRARRRVEIGPLILLNEERCIRCGRCTRFVSKVTGVETLYFFARGNSTFVSISPDLPLDFPYQNCLVDLCPVGAITLKDFRFKCPVWLLKSSPSFCTLCSTLCPITVQTDGKRIVRIKPSGETQNLSFICDYGRLSFKAIDDPMRLLMPSVYGATTTLARAIDSLIQSLSSIVKRRGRIGAVITPLMSLEEMLFIVRFVQELSGNLYKCQNPTPSFPLPHYSDDFLISAEKMPNIPGFEKVCSRFGISMDVETLLKDIVNGEIEGIISTSFNLFDTIPQEKWSILLEAPFTLTFSSRQSQMKQANYIFPLPLLHEYSGTFVKRDGKPVVSKMIIPPPPSILPVTNIIMSIGKALSLKSFLNDEETLIEKLMSDMGISGAKDTHWE